MNQTFSFPFRRCFGLRAIESILGSRQDPKIIILTVYEEDDLIFTAFRLGTLMRPLCACMIWWVTVNPMPQCSAMGWEVKKGSTGCDPHGHRNGNPGCRPAGHRKHPRLQVGVISQIGKQDLESSAFSFFAFHTDAPFMCLYDLVGYRVHNLVTNAVDAMSGLPSERKNLTFTLRSLDQWIALSISDTGLGMRPQNLSHIFEPFFTMIEIFTAVIDMGQLFAVLFRNVQKTDFRLDGQQLVFHVMAERFRRSIGGIDTAGNADFNVTVNAVDNIPPAFLDANYFEQAVHNLVTNAVDAMSGLPSAA